MGFPSRYDHRAIERQWQDAWAAERTYAFDPSDPRPIFAVDTPPPTVSGEIHIGHVYSYIQAEAMIRFQRMQGQRVYYPFGFDDNGLPTERYVERTRGIRARDVGRVAFIAACLETSREVEDRFEQFWQSLGMSVDWRLRYSTIDPHARRISQWSFIDLYQRGRIYRAQAPNPWCVECQTAIAQAELDDAERATTFYTISFPTDAPGLALPIATTRPELLPACVAVFVHPDDARYAGLVGRRAEVPLAGRAVPILADALVDPAKGTGAVMCCTFGDATDLVWWRSHQLPLIALVTRQGTLGEAAGLYAGLRLAAARAQILEDLRGAGLLTGKRAASQTVRIHERCKTPVEILETSQWFIRVLDLKEQLLEAGRQIAWHPAGMRARYEHWVTNLSWDWCISRQRFYGVPFPAWHCRACGAVRLAELGQLPVDPTSDAPPGPCACGSLDLEPDTDVMDTWATSSVSPLIAQHFPEAGELRFTPEAPAPRRMQLRPQAHDIIRTWAFDTIVKHHLHFGEIPWETIMISGHALAADGSSIHKSLGNSPIAPARLIERHGADAVRYWACSGGLGADQPLHEELMRQGGRLGTKLWNAARFLDRFAEQARQEAALPGRALPTDRALLSWTQRMIEQADAHYRRYDYAGALAVVERFFWDTLCDQALEWTKGRLYDGSPEDRLAALLPLQRALLAVLTLLAPVMPHVTEAIYQLQRRDQPGPLQSIHLSGWPAVDAGLVDPEAEAAGRAVIAIGTAVRRYKTAQQIGLSTRLALLSIDARGAGAGAALAASAVDLESLTRADEIRFAPLEAGEEIAPGLRVAIARHGAVEGGVL